MKEAEPTCGGGGSAGLSSLGYTFTALIFGTEIHGFVSGIPYSRFSRYCGSRQGLISFPFQVVFPKLDWSWIMTDFDAKSNTKMLSIQLTAFVRGLPFGT
ncbi:MAG TPA: hypothetical protein VK788_25120 [Terriglobales bacterium]|jgi:hypothetical protein|nr:hypothetical protein [Terriglobales bacterium]